MKTLFGTMAAAALREHRKTKRLAIILGTCLMLAAALVTPALGAAEKVALVPCFEDLPNLCADPTGEASPGTGFVVFNGRDASAGPNNLLITVALKGVEPDTAYDVWLFVGSVNGGTKLGTVTTNGQGNAIFPAFAALTAGPHDLGIDVTEEGSLSDVYLSEGFYSNADMSATLTFK